MTKNSKIILIILIIILLGASVFYYFSQSKSPPVLSLEEKKEAVIDRLRNIDANPLLPAERADIVDFVSRGGATYTEAEKVEITHILRSK